MIPLACFANSPSDAAGIVLFLLAAGVFLFIMGFRKYRQ